MLASCRPVHTPFSNPQGAPWGTPNKALKPKMHRLALLTAGAAASGQTAVAESLHLLRFAPDTPQEEISQVVDGIWSLQYLAAGPVCGSAGPLRQFRQAAAAGDGGSGQPFTHAVLFRYGNAANLERFEAQPRVQLMLSATGAPSGMGITTLNFRGSVPNELEAIFRRGSEWETGQELIVALALQGGSGEEDAAEFLSLTQQLALSSAFSAVQCSYGPTLSMQQHSGSGSGTDAQGDEAAAVQAAAQQAGQQGQQAGQQGALAQPDMVLLVRFMEQEQLQLFLECPPVAALMEGDERIPLKALWSCALEIAPSDSSSTRGVAGGLV